ncbi:hypothetical protein CGLO_00459 [Colletotrichum gloeosporioides Cg-14]|uniref:Uncharacterized protein n=1 Tax=Colletotrichum gloeosporioides (strain Cg-14) TaxID=1237896 RepID=T0M6T4_COLGC|nr:hypothetical protein CGLO_00459 [Colletotrichum gloeosporioides Cg-14]
MRQLLGPARVAQGISNLIAEGGLADVEEGDIKDDEGVDEALGLVNVVLGLPDVGRVLAEDNLGENGGDLETSSSASSSASTRNWTSDCFADMSPLNTLVEYFYHGWFSRGMTPSTLARSAAMGAKRVVSGDIILESVAIKVDGALEKIGEEH